MADPRIAIVGAGAVGCIVASALIRNGESFIWCESSRRRLREISSPRIEIGDQLLDIEHELITVEADASAIPDGLDLLVIAVKSMHVQTVLDSVTYDPSSTLVIANGYLQGDFNLGLLYGGGSVSADGTAMLMPDNRLVCGALGTADRIELDSRLQAPWLQLAADTDIEVRMFHKLALNCVINPLSVIIDGPNGLVSGPAHRTLVKAILSEADLVARTLLGERWIYNPVSLLEDCLYLIDLTASNTSSMRADIMAGRKPEVSTLNLAIASLGEENGIKCPCNTYIGSMISLLANSGVL